MEHNINFLTSKILGFITYNKLQPYFCTSLSPTDSKKLFWDLFKDRLNDVERKGFIKGAKLIQFDIIYEAFKA